MQLDDFGYAAELATGIRCGAHGRVKVYHDSTETVRYCYAKMRSDIAEQEAEAAAELAYERHLEDRGYDEARAQDEYEQRNGVIPFDVAMRNAGYCDEHGWDPCQH
jgi:hypothetical protein